MRYWIDKYKTVFKAENKNTKYLWFDDRYNNWKIGICASINNLEQPFIEIDELDLLFYGVEGNETIRF